MEAAFFTPQQSEATGRFEQALRVIDRNGDNRMSHRQAVALMAVFSAEAAQTPMLVGEVTEIAKTGANALDLFYAPDPIRNPRGLDLIYQQPDKIDRRKKYLRLTPKGIALALEVAAAMEGKQ